MPCIVLCALLGLQGRTHDRAVLRYRIDQVHFWLFRDRLHKSIDTCTDVLVDCIESSNRVCEDEKDDSEGEVDEVSEEAIVKNIFELGLHFVE